MIVEFLCNHGCLYYAGWRPNSLFLSHGWCHSLCTMAFHCLGVKNPCMRVHSCTLSLLIILLISPKVCWVGLLEGPCCRMVFQEDAFFYLLIFFFSPYFSFLKPSLLSSLTVVYIVLVYICLHNYFIES